MYSEISKLVEPNNSLNIIQTKSGKRLPKYIKGDKRSSLLMLKGIKGNKKYYMNRQFKILFKKNIFIKYK